MTSAIQDSASPQSSVWESLARALSPLEQRPCVVANIEATHQKTRAGTSYVVIRNPAANTYLKLDPHEYDLLPLMDGTRTVKALVVEYYQRHGVLALPRVSGLVQLLRAHHFLSDPPFDTYAALGARLRRLDAVGLLSRIARGFRFSDLSLTQVDAPFDALYRSLGWAFFTPPAIVMGFSLALAGSALYFVELSRDRYPLFQIGGSYLIAFLLFTGLWSVTLFIHELGHAMAVKHAGRHVPRGGVLLYYGLPAAYVDTTDIWMAPRRLRLVTSFAGPYTGLVLGGLCGIAAFLLPQGAPGSFLFAWGFVLIVNALFNFNPLLELDGYYLLVDLIEKPSLRARALNFVRGPLLKKLRWRQSFTHEEILFAAFGLASLAYSFFALFLALRFWELRLSRFLSEALASDNGVARLAVFLVLTIITVPIVFALWRLARRLAGSLALRVAWLSKRAAIQLNREALAALRAVPLWAGLPAERLLEVARAMRVENVAAGNEVVRQGELGERFYLIAYGAFEVLVNEQPATRLGRGEYFGELALLNDAPRAATVVAVEPGRVYSLDRAAFRTTLAHDLATQVRIQAALAYREAVAAMPLFRDLAPVDLDLLLTRFVRVGVGTGEDIIGQGQSGDRFYVILSGAVDVIKDGQMIGKCVRGDAFGELALLLNAPRAATVRATESTELLALNAADFQDLLVRYLGRAADLQRLTSLALPAQHHVNHEWGAAAVS